MLKSCFIRAKDAYTRLYAHEPSPMFRRKFDISESPERAVIRIATPGFYRLFVNGEDVTKGYLAPYIANPEHFVFYDKYDVTSRLTKGKNVIAVILGNGFQNASGGLNWQFDRAAWTGPLSFALTLDLSVAGEWHTHLFSDEKFLTHDSPYEYDDIRMGVVYDAREELDGVYLADFDDSGWSPAIPTDAPRGDLRACTADPILPRYELKPRKIDFVGDGYFMPTECKSGAEYAEDATYKDAYLYDFGENCAGVVRLKICAEAGRKIVLRFGELLVDGKFQLRNLSSVKTEEIFRAYKEYNQRVVYTCRDGENVFVPDFTYFGFRYVLVEGITEREATEELLTYVVLSSDMKQKTRFSSSSEIANKLFDATIRSDYSNILYIPTDCPHREKNGWTGDASVSAEQFMLNLAAEKTLAEWMRCVAKAQNADGVIPGVVPTGGWCYTGLRGPLWDSVCVTVPYYIYKYSGDITALSDAADMIYRYLDNIEKMRDARGIVDYGLTDWNQPDRPSSKPDAPRAVTDTAQCIEIARLAKEIFDILGKDEWARRADALRLSLRASFREQLTDLDTMTVAGRCQTSQVLGIAFEIFDEREMAAAKDVLLTLIKESDEHIACGMLGLRYIFHVLCDMGEAALALRMICRTDRIGYGFWIKEGYGTLWETFAKPEGPHVSKNHHYFGDISSIFVQRIAGLQPNPTARDITEFKICPELSSGLEYARAEYESHLGRVCTEWKTVSGGYIIKAEIPSGAHGKIATPKGFAFTDGTSEKPLATGEYTVMKI